MPRWIYAAGRTAITIAVLLFVLVGGLAWGYRSVQQATAPKPPPPCVTTETKALIPAQVSIRVLNGGSVIGLAGTVSTAMRSRGFVVLRTGNTDEHINGTIIVGAKESNPEVQLVAGYFEKATIRTDGRKDGTVDVLVGDQYGGLTKTPPTSVAVPGGVVCLPSSTPSPSGPVASSLASPSVTPTPTPTAKKS